MAVAIPPATTTPIVNNSGTTTNTPSTANSNANANANTNTGNANTNANTNTGNTNTNINHTADGAKNFQSQFGFYNADKIKKGINATNLSNVKITHNGVNTDNSGTLYLANLPLGLSFNKIDYTAIATIYGTNQPVQASTVVPVYQQPNSVVLGEEGKGTVGGHAVRDKAFFVTQLHGNKTTTLPTAGKFNYSGASFNDTQKGDFKYTIDFGTKTGQGSLTLGNKTATLDQSAIINVKRQSNDDLHDGLGIQGNVSGGITGHYTLGIFGNNAQEVAGYVTGSDNVGFAGSKQ